MKLMTKSPEDTFELGLAIGRQIGPKSIICIGGEMGAGKTALSQGIIRGLGVTDKYITSPTYTLVNEYKVDGVDVYHFDIYRVGDYDELSAIGFEEYFRENSVVIIEWADIIKDYLIGTSLWVHITSNQITNSRLVSIEGEESYIDQLAQTLGKWEYNENTCN